MLSRRLALVILAVFEVIIFGGEKFADSSWLRRRMRAIALASFTHPSSDAFG